MLVAEMAAPPVVCREEIMHKDSCKIIQRFLKRIVLLSIATVALGLQGVSVVHAQDSWPRTLVSSESGIATDPLPLTDVKTRDGDPNYPSAVRIPWLASGSSTSLIYRIEGNASPTTPAVRTTANLYAYDPIAAPGATYWIKACGEDRCSDFGLPDMSWQILETGDGYEDDDTLEQAHWIYSGTPQTHSISPATDSDWVKFRLYTTSAVLLETSGATNSDTRMYLYKDTRLTHYFDWNDDIDNGGGNYYSYLEYTCDVDPLPAGIYYVRIDEYENNQEIPSYNPSFTVTQICHIPSTPLPISPSGIIGDTRPFFKWNSSGGSSSYKLAVWSYSSASYAILQTKVPITSCIGGICTYCPDAALAPGAYRFKVLARNAVGNSPYSAWVYFDVSP